MISSSSGNVKTLTQTQLADFYQSRLESCFGSEGKEVGVIEAKQAVARGISNGVRHAVFRSSLDQAIRGNVSFGVLNSVTYVAKKIKKFIK